MGGNLGAGLQFKLGKNFTLVTEALPFSDPEVRMVGGHRRSLSSSSRPLDALSRVPLVEFKPQFFQVTGGITIGTATAAAIAARPDHGLESPT
jgi:hypothetical protein